jgi:hypothetical protein
MHPDILRHREAIADLCRRCGVTLFRELDVVRTTSSLNRLDGRLAALGAMRPLDSCKGG